MLRPVRRTNAWMATMLDRVSTLASWPVVTGTAWAMVTLLIWGSWPAYTRLAVTESVTPEDLVLMRYGIGGLVLLPLLIVQIPRMPRNAWREGLVLAAFQGAPLALLTTTGVRWTPASHLAAISPGIMPIFLALIGRIVFKERVSWPSVIGLSLIGLGAAAIIGSSLVALSGDSWRGDLCFVTACLMGSIYVIRIRRSGLSAVQGAAMISVYSMIFYLPLYFWLWSGASLIPLVSGQEVLFQALYQGILMGALTLYSLSRTMLLLGAARGAALMALDPVIAATLGYVVLRESPSIIESLAVIVISLGVLIATTMPDRG